jgi:creatinine amidohydrolase
MKRETLRGTLAAQARSYTISPCTGNAAGRAIGAQETMRPWVLAETNYQAVLSQPAPQVALLPLGATEPHNLHLPYGTDTFQVQKIGEQACQLASQRGAKVLMLPALPYGTETNLARFPLAMNLNPTTVAQVITDLLESLAAHNILKCVLLNGHGGNDLKWVLRQLYGKTPVHLFLCNWYKVGADQHPAIFQEAGDHAGELETSMGLAHFPTLVAPEQADLGRTAKSRFEAINRGWVEITRPWHLLTTNSGAGNPHPATAAKGHALTTLVTERIAAFLAELSASPIDERFPFA